MALEEVGTQLGGQKAYWTQHEGLDPVDPQGRMDVPTARHAETQTPLMLRHFDLADAVALDGSDTQEYEEDYFPGDAIHGVPAEALLPMKLIPRWTQLLVMVATVFVLIIVAFLLVVLLSWPVG